MADPNDLMAPEDLKDLTLPLMEEIMNTYISGKFKKPIIEAYFGTGHPANHVRMFSSTLLL